MNAFSLYLFLEHLVPHQLKLPTHTLNLSLPHLSTSTTSSLIPTSADAWHRTPTSTLLNSFSSLVMNPLDPPSNKIKLNFNHPCKELIFVCQPDAHVAYCDSFLPGRLMLKALGAQPFNYSDAVDALPNSILAFGSATSYVDPPQMKSRCRSFQRHSSYGYISAG